MPKTYCSVEDGQEIMLEKFYDLPEAVRCAEQTEEAKEVFVFKENEDDHELIGCHWVRENKNNKGTPEQRCSLFHIPGSPQTTRMIDESGQVLRNLREPDCFSCCLRNRGL